MLYSSPSIMTMLAHYLLPLRALESVQPPRKRFLQVGKEHKLICPWPQSHMVARATDNPDRPQTYETHTCA
jgi:hypothetical protein